MHPQMRLLNRLQQLDDELDKLHQLLERLDPGEHLRQRLNESRRRMEEIKQRYRELQALAQDQQLKLQNTEERIRQAEAELYSGRIRNPRELEALQHDIDAMRRAHDQMELDLLRLWEEMETQGQEIEETEADLHQIEAMLEEHQRRYQEQKARIEAEIAKREAARTQLVAQIEPALVQRYETMRPRLARKAVAPVEDEVCAACRTRLTPYLVNRLRESRDPVTCESCGRMLYWAALDPPETPS